ncbi:hypothetical protein BH23BAC1_BH23BAC1_27050 [soil metagenome]
MVKVLQPDLIINGNIRRKRFEKVPLGSNTVSVIENSSVPVLAIPQDVDFSPPKKIVYATDYNESALDDLKELATLAECFDSEILVVHITEKKLEEEEEEEEDTSRRKSFIDFVQKNVFYPKISYRVTENVSIQIGIKLFVEKENADILAIATKKRNQFQKLISKSLTKGFVSGITLPDLAFHVTQKKESISINE